MLQGSQATSGQLVPTWLGRTDRDGLFTGDLAECATSRRTTLGITQDFSVPETQGNRYVLYGGTLFILF